MFGNEHFHKSVWFFALALFVLTCPSLIHAEEEEGSILPPTGSMQTMAPTIGSLTPSQGPMPLESVAVTDIQDLVLPDVVKPKAAKEAPLLPIKLPETQSCVFGSLIGK